MRLADKREFAGKLVGTDPNTDLALVKVSASGLPTVALGDSDRLRVGDWVCAIGNPYSFDHTVTAGVVSSKGRKIFNASFDAYIQTDAAINPGNSGGPLIDDGGDAVGINAAVSMEGQGIGFAIPINVARDIMGQLRAAGDASHEATWAFSSRRSSRTCRGSSGSRRPAARSSSTWSRGAPASAGLKRYDVITAISGEPSRTGTGWST